MLRNFEGGVKKSVMRCYRRGEWGGEFCRKKRYVIFERSSATLCFSFVNYRVLTISHNFLTFFRTVLIGTWAVGKRVLNGYSKKS